MPKEQSLVESSFINILWNDFRGKSAIPTFIWNDGLIITVTIDSFSESDNGKELNDPEYLEFEAAYITVKKIIECKLSFDAIHDRFGGPMIYEGIGYEISFLNAPDIILKDGVVIWEKPAAQNNLAK